MYNSAYLLTLNNFEDYIHTSCRTPILLANTDDSDNALLLRHLADEKVPSDCQIRIETVRGSKLYVSLKRPSNETLTPKEMSKRHFELAQVAGLNYTFSADKRDLVIDLAEPLGEDDEIVVNCYRGNHGDAKHIRSYNERMQNICDITVVKLLGNTVD